MVTLAYDPNGRLWQLAAPSGTTRFVYDGDQILIESDGAGNLLRAYVHGTAEDEPLLWYEALPGGASRRFLHADHQGSIVAVADQDGNPLAINAYDAWGIPNAGNQGRFGYTGQAWLPELGMWYYKARIYSPTLGRFLQTDPIGYKDQVNLYAYVGNDPVDARDPSGEKVEAPDPGLKRQTLRVANSWPEFKVKMKEMIGNNHTLTIVEAHTRDEVGYFVDPVAASNGHGSDVIIKVLKTPGGHRQANCA